LIGTPMYMAPEQCCGAEVDARTDVYALGCILYELACGHPPFVKGGLGLILGAHVYEPVPPPRSVLPAVPEALEQLILRALAKAPDDRYLSMQALALDLDTLTERRG
jgi:serine/threonine protein kinase